MRYLGTAKVENGHVIMPDGFDADVRVGTYEAVEIGGDILLTATPLDRKRLERVGKLAAQSIDDHRKSLEGLAEAYVRHGVVTAGHLTDAQHVAVATVGELDVLVSWNYRHLVNRRRREAFNGVNAIQGYRTIDIVTPPEVFDE